MKPAEKNPDINKFIENTLGGNRVMGVLSDVCVSCSKPAHEFRNDISRKEYSISGLCQKCQDSVFGVN